MYIITDECEEHNYAIKLVFKTMKNEVEYEALFFDLTIAKSLGTSQLLASEYRGNSWQSVKI